jgi:hypothetical protein
LSLNDAVATFSSAILPLLCKLKIKLPLIEPSEKFLKKIIPKIEHEQIDCLHLKANQFNRIMELSPLNTYTKVQALILEKFPEKILGYNIRKYFPGVTYFSIHYDGEVNFHRVCKIFQLIHDSIKRFEIHCDAILCSHRRLEYLFNIVRSNIHIESFILYLDHTSWSVLNKCGQSYRKCLLKTIIDFIRIMSNIRCVRIIVNKGYVETLLGVDEWTELVENCRNLEKITLKVMKNMSQDIKLGEKIQEIENSLHNIRPSIQFQVKVT